ncbi:MAG: UvrD-helicase domain-containing protein [Coriobacteriia bacterium]|nr:UvrD-helicase domain-containing protein [Coriobacteriia bacterium]
MAVEPTAADSNPTLNPDSSPLNPPSTPLNSQEAPLNAVSGVEDCDAPADDPVFIEEQRHLSQTYATLCELERSISDRLESDRAEMQQFKENADDELSTDVDRGDDGDDFSASMETYAAYAAMNNVVDSFNISIDMAEENLARTRQLIHHAYFAKVRLKFAHRDEPRDIYLGSTGMTDADHRQLVVDWRSPVAETYYNQQTGPMSYVANGRTIHADLQLRRQFDLAEDKLHAYFDTTVAIEDPLLLASLSQRRSSQLAAITATIQREQNLIIRHADVPALLVRGVAGSGKTSVMLQRIAYLLYQQRASLNANQVYLLSPNPVFARYIKNVLPELGEKNPHTLLWSELMERIGPGDRNLGADVSPEDLLLIDERAKDLVLDPDDVRELRAGERVLMSGPQVWRCVEKYLRKDPTVGPRLSALVEDDLAEKLERRIAQLVGDDKVHADMLALDADEQDRVFGGPINPIEEDELAECARTYLDDLCAPLFAQIESGGWLRLDRVGMRMLGKQSLTALEWVYLKMVVMGKVDPAAKLVMVDEVQDYSVTQLMVLARYFSRAHFLMLGDPNQAIRPGTASFDDIRALFERERGGVSECELMTSYRSSPEITALFSSLLPEDERLRVSSVLRPGIEPSVKACADLDEYRSTLVGAIESARGEGDGLTAVVVNSRRRVKWLGDLLGEAMGERAPQPIFEGDALPPSGVVLIDLRLAKGLEFDRVIIADAQAEEFPGDDLSRRRLYTAISRATQRVTIVAQGDLTPLLGAFAK